MASGWRGLGGARGRPSVGRRLSTGSGAWAEARRLLVAFSLPFVSYLTTLAPTVYNLDSAELTTAAYSGGLVRATGYPLYLILGRFWSRLPLGNVGWRMNLMSAVCAALTIALADRLLRKLGVPGWARLAALGLLASSRYFWAMATTAEVYTLHTLMVVVVLLMLMRFGEHPSAGRLALATFVVGISFGNHVATVLLAPACVWFVLRTTGRGALTGRTLSAATAGLAAGLSLYFYLTLVYLGDPVFNYAGRYGADGEFLAADLTTLAGMWWLVSGKAFAAVMVGYTPRELVGEVGHFLAELVRAFVGVGIGPALVGFVVLRRRAAPLAEALALVALATASFYVTYRVIDKDTMYLPVYLVWALLLAEGYRVLDAWLGSEGASRLIGAARWAVRTVAVCAVVFAVAWNGPLVDLSDDHSTYNRGLAVLARAAPEALVIGWWSTVPVVEYLQLVEGRRLDIEALNRFLIPTEDLEELVETRLAAGQPVYFDEPPSELFPDVVVEREGPIFRVHQLSAPEFNPIRREESTP